MIDPGDFVIVHLQNPKEKFWGMLVRLDGAGATLYGIDLTATQLVTVGVTSVLLTFSVPGIPGGSILIMAPVLLAVGLPVEGIGILLGVDTIPDMFRTTANVTGTMTAAVVLEPPGRE